MPPEVPCSIPAVLRDRHEVVRLLGRGAFGEVVLARDRELGRHVAIKTLRHSLSDEVAVMRFRREAKLTAELGHPHVLTVYDHGVETGGEAWILYEFVEGRDLRSLLGRGGRPGVEEVVLWGRQIASALAAAHRVGIVHRDVKPENVLLRTPRHALLADFGIARPGVQGTALTAEGVILGTPPYMATEVWRGEVPTPASDQFAWAVCLHELLCGTLPWEDATPAGILSSLSRGRPLVVSEPWRGRHPELSGVIERGMALDPGDRYPSMQAFTRALEELAEAGPVRAGEATGPVPETRQLDPVRPSGEEEAVTTWVADARPRGRRRSLVGPALAAMVAAMVLGALLRPGGGASREPAPVVPPPAATRPPGDPDRVRFEADLERLLAYHEVGNGGLASCTVVGFDDWWHLSPRVERLAAPQLPADWHRFLESLNGFARTRASNRLTGDVRAETLTAFENEAYLAYHVADDLKNLLIAAGMGLGPSWVTTPGGPDLLRIHGEALQRNWEELQQYLLETPPVAVPGPYGARLGALRDMLEGLMDLGEGGGMVAGERFRRARARLERSDDLPVGGLVLDAAVILLYPGYHPGITDCRELRGLFEQVSGLYLVNRARLDPSREAELVARLVLADVLVDPCGGGRSEADAGRTRELRRIALEAVGRAPWIVDGILVDGVVLQQLEAGSPGPRGDLARGFLEFQEHVRARTRAREVAERRARPGAGH